jgi:hypothetical protein
MDETVFSSRPLKNRRRRGVAGKSCPIPSHWSDQPDASHISVGGTLSLAFERSGPVLLTVVNVPFQDSELNALRDHISMFNTPKSEMTIPAIHAYIIHHSEDLPIFLIIDHHRPQKSHAVLQQLSDLQTHPIWLPAHITLLLPPRDFRVFAALNNHDLNLRRRRTQKRIERRLLRPFLASQQATDCGRIYSAWMADAIEIRRGSSLEFTCVVKLHSVNKIRTENRQQSPSSGDLSQDMDSDF